MRVKNYRLRTFERYALALVDKCFDLEGLGYLPKAEEIDSEMFTTQGQYAKHKLKAVTNPDKEKVEKQRKLMEAMEGRAMKLEQIQSIKTQR